MTASLAFVALGTTALGFDLSLTSTGGAFVGPEPEAWRWRTTPKEGQDAWRRAVIADHVAGAVYGYEPDLVVIEAVPTHGAFAIAPLAMLHGVVLDRLKTEQVPVYTFPASVLKKYATGNGRAQKADMVAAAQAVGYEGKQEDEADAWLLALVGSHLAGSTEHLTPQRSSCLQSASLVLGSAAVVAGVGPRWKQRSGWVAPLSALTSTPATSTSCSIGSACSHST